ncbi:MAG: IS21-like element helper ATPase IstB [Desulfarculaceae bacterium]|nr:IS21-like element helper ATPase IstB [Desulfarculaceae bacterium]
MSGFDNAPDIMGEALGRLPLRPSLAQGKVVSMAPEAAARTKALLDKMKRMRLTGMAAALEEQMARTPSLPPALVNHLERLVEREEAERSARRVQRRIKKAGLKVEATVEGIDHSHPRNLNRALAAEIAACGWVAKGCNLIITGPIGSGKTYLASAFTRAACLRGYNALYRRLPELLRELAEARAKKGLEQYMASLAKLDLLCLDDWGLELLDHQQGMDLLQIVEERYGKKAMIVASLLPVDEWGLVMDNPAIAEAVSDRVAATAHCINLSGESLRQEYASRR